MIPTIGNKAIFFGLLAGFIAIRGNSQSIGLKQDEYRKYIQRTGGFFPPPGLRPGK